MQDSTKKLVLSAMFTAIGIILPFITGHVPAIGNMLCPMHIPVLICGFLCGWQYGLIVGFALPYLRYLLVGFPVLIPNGLAMSFELAAYGGLSGFLYARVKKPSPGSLYACLIGAMIGGRIVWGLVRTLLSHFIGAAFGWQAFASGAFLTAIPGIIIQLILIPAILIGLDRAGFGGFNKTV